MREGIVGPGRMELNGRPDLWIVTAAGSSKAKQRRGARSAYGAADRQVGNYSGWKLSPTRKRKGQSAQPGIVPAKAVRLNGVKRPINWQIAS